MSPVPKLVAFDLDGTLWNPEMYELWGGAPFRRDKEGRVYDSANQRIDLIGATADILRELATDPKWKGTQVAYVSRTEYPERAIPCLKAFIIAEATSMFDLAPHQEIYPGSKTSHFKKISRASGIDFEEMIFFDNERWNITDCSPLGITCVYTPEGLTRRHWEEGLKRYAAAAAKRNGGSTAEDS